MVMYVHSSESLIMKKGKLFISMPEAPAGGIIPLPPPPLYVYLSRSTKGTPIHGMARGGISFLRKCY